MWGDWGSTFWVLRRSAGLLLGGGFISVLCTCSSLLSSLSTFPCFLFVLLVELTVVLARPGEVLLDWVFLPVLKAAPRILFCVVDLLVGKVFVV